MLYLSGVYMNSSLTFRDTTHEPQSSTDFVPSLITRPPKIKQHSSFSNLQIEAPGHNDSWWVPKYESQDCVAHLPVSSCICRTTNSKLITVCTTIWSNDQIISRTVYHTFRMSVVCLYWGIMHAVELQLYFALIACLTLASCDAEVIVPPRYSEASFTYLISPAKPHFL